MKMSTTKAEEEMELAEVRLPPPNISQIKNKQRRTEMYKKLKRENDKVSCGTYIIAH